jgi:hypothetical protein
LRLRDFTVLTLTIFSIKLLFPGPSCDPGYLSSQKDFCPASAVTRFCLLQQSGYVKIMVRIHFVLTLLQFVYSPFFSIKFQFSGPSRDPGYLSSQLDFCPAVAATCSCLLQQSGYVKIMVRIHFVLTILQFVCSPFFQLNCYFWAIAQSVISQPTDGF